MNKVLEEIRRSITEPMAKLDISVESVTYVVEGNYNLGLFDSAFEYYK